MNKFDWVPSSIPTYGLISCQLPFSAVRWQQGALIRSSNSEQIMVLLSPAFCNLKDFLTEVFKVVVKYF
jgi:hypothetical protein